MRYYIYDQIKNGDNFVDEVKATNDKDAVLTADMFWKGLAEIDKKRREVYLLVKVAEENIDEDGCFLLDHAETIKNYIE